MKDLYMRMLILIVISYLFPAISRSQSLSGVVTYSSLGGSPRPSVGERVYLIPCKNCNYKMFPYILSYTLTKSLKSKDSKEDMDKVFLYKVKIDSLKREYIKIGIVNGSGDYNIDMPKAGRYMLLFESLKCDAYNFELINVAGKTVRSDYSFSFCR